MESKKQAKFISFLQEELAIPSSAVSLALRRVEQTPSLLPMVLWQYGLVTLTQLNQIFDWLDVASSI
ncbi:MAG: DUF2949 domain-containing protein [Scytonema sp. RU_4_4]|nr:DUF2949 domain-containing protein [Scytonema sp. RU_4_4]